MSLAIPPGSETRCHWQFHLGVSLTEFELASLSAVSLRMDEESVPGPPDVFKKGENLLDASIELVERKVKEGCHVV